MASITQSTVGQLRPGQLMVDDKLPGFTCRKLPSGRLSYGLRYVVKGKQRWLALGVGITPAKARELAEQRRGDVAAGKDPQAERQAERKARSSTVAGLLDDHMRLYVRPNLRSADEIERIFDVYVKPAIGKTPVLHLRRSEVAGMLEKVAKAHGPVQADRVLAHVRKAFNWHAARDERFVPPIVKGMGKAKPVAQRARRRVLSDQEIRDLWRALDAASVTSCFPSLVRFMLLSARRPSEPVGMTWPEVESDDVWVIPEERGEKQGHKVADQAGAMAIPLTAQMRALMGKPEKRGRVFHSGDSSVGYDGWSKDKRALDKAIGELRAAEGRSPMPPWQIGRDIRRTARTLMSRAGVPSRHAELALGHVLTGVERTYDRHEYLSERRDALEKLGRLVERILAGEVTGNVIRPAVFQTA